MLRRCARLCLPPLRLFEREVLNKWLSESVTLTADDDDDEEEEEDNGECNNAVKIGTLRFLPLPSFGR